MRVFVAVFPPAAVVASLGAWLERVRRPGDGVSWVRSANLHYTLRFLGELVERRVAAVTRAAGEAVRGAAPFAMELGEAGGFPDLRRPRVLWIGTRAGAGELELLARSLDEALRREGFPRAEKPFRAHLTVGRVRDPRRAGGLAERLATGAPRDRFPVERLVVVHSTLDPGGSIYRPVAEVPLGGPAGPPGR